MFTTTRKFAKALHVLAVLVMLSLSLTATAFADAPRYPEQTSCSGYPGDQNCQCYQTYQCYQCYQSYQGYQCNQCYQSYQCYQNNQNYPSYPSYPSTPANPPTAAGSGPDTAQMLGSGGGTVAARGQQWYRFPVQPPTYSDGSRGTLNLDVTLTNQSGQASFEVLTSNNVNQWQNGVQYSPLGAGSASTSPQGTPILFWHGSFNQPLTLYVVVKNNSDQAASFTLNLNVSTG